MTSNSDKTIVVSGASSGIGKASAGALLGAGFRVLACVRSDSAAEALERELMSRASGRLQTLRLDVTRPDQVRAAAAEVEAAVGERGLWGLFNNAGIAVAGPMECTPVDELRRQFEVNVFGQVAVTQAFLPLLRRARGRILNTGSIAGFGTVPGLGPYSMSKHAMEALSDALRRELRPWGIAVSLLEPGSIATEIWGKSADAFEANLKSPPPGLVELYGPLTRTLNEFAAKSARDASPVSVVTKDVVHAFTAARPRTRYCKGHGTGVRKVLRRLPDRWVDAVFARTLRWG